MPSIFDKKNFNTEVFAGYVGRVPNTKRKAMITSRAIRPRPDLAAAMKDQSGGNYITTTLTGLISGSVPQNYDGTTNMSPSTTDTFRHSRVVVGRMNAWTEKDFSKDITGGEDFMENIAQQISEYWSEIDQDTLLHILKGVFSMTGTENLEFVNNHTSNVVAVVNSEGKTGYADATTFNSAMQKACGDNKSAFSLALLHSVVSTNLENLKILSYLKYTDKDGMEREIGLASLNGRMVLIDDDMPVEEVPATYKASQDTSVKTGKAYYTRSGSSPNYVYTKVASPTGNPSTSSYYEADTTVKHYTSFVLGDGAFEYTDCGAAVPYEVDRDPKTNGGQDTLYSRQRKCFAPYGISFTMASMATLSPTDAELETGANWELVNSNTNTGKKYIAHKAIPIARIISLG